MSASLYASAWCRNCQTMSLFRRGYCGRCDAYDGAFGPPAPAAPQPIAEPVRQVATDRTARQAWSDC